MSGFDIFVIVLVVLAIFTLIAGVKTVSQGYHWTVERFGKYTRTLEPGLNLIVPYFDRIGRKMNMMEQVIDIPQQEVITKDNATVTVDGVAFYQVFDAAKASYEVSRLDQAIITLTMTNIRSVMGAMDLDQMLSHRDEINEKLLRVVDAAVGALGRQGHAHRDQGHRAAGQSRAVDGTPDAGRAREARRDSRRRRPAPVRDPARRGRQAVADPRSRRPPRGGVPRRRGPRALAQAEAKATEMVSEAVSRGDVAALNYFVAEKYLKAFGQLAESPNQKVLMLPIEAMGVLGSLAGIGEIAKATFGGDGAGGAAAARRPVPPTGPSAGQR